MYAARLFLALATLPVLAGGWAAQAAEQPVLQATQYVAEQWQRKDGLPVTSALGLAQDAEGYLWMAAFEGLIRFDGINFSLLTSRNTEGLAAANFTAVQRLRDGSLAASSRNGGLALRVGGRWRTLTQTDGLPADGLHFLSEDAAGRLWLASDAGLVRAEGPWTQPRFTLLGAAEGLPPGRVNFVRQERDGQFYVATVRGLWRGDGQRFERVPATAALGDTGFVRALLDRRGRLWATSERTALHVFEEGRPPVAYNSQNGLLTNEIYEVLEWDGAIWASSDRGLIRLSDRHGLEILTAKTGLGADNLGGLFVDAEDSLWVGAWRGGLSRLRRGKFVNYGERQGLPDGVVFAVDQDAAGDVWFASSVGLFRLDRATGVIVEIQGVPNGQVRDVEFAPEGTYAAVFNRGLIRVNGDRVDRHWRGPEDGLADNRVRVLSRQPSDDSLWIGSSAGLIVKRGEIITRENLGQPLLDKSILHITGAADGTLWFALNFDGLLRLRGGQATHWDAQHGLPANVVFHTTLIGETAWVATQGGLVRLRGDEVRVLTVNDGLPADSLYFVERDNAGMLWAGGAADGVLRLDPAEIQAYWDGRHPRVPFNNFGLADGIAAPEISVPSRVLRDRDGWLWFPTLRGVSAIDPQNYPVNRRPPRIVLEGMSLDSDVRGELLAEVPAGVRRLSFHFTALSLVAAERNRFLVRLGGFDEEWVDTRGRREAAFTNLAPGEYVLQVRAFNHDGVAAREDAEWRFTVRPHFWQTWWFYGLCAGLLGLGGYGFYRLRVRQLRRRGAELQELVAARTKDLQEQARLLREQAARLRLADTEVQDSLQYAARIQQAVVLSKAALRPPGFEVEVLFQPCKVVSGDFYWVWQRRPYLYAGVFDCTGHGVPGAFLSLLGDLLLRRAVIEQGLTDPGEILQSLERQFGELFAGASAQALARESMDGALCVLHEDREEVLFAGARRPLWVVRRDGTLHEVAGSRRTIGVRSVPGAERGGFATERISLARGCTALLFSDGYADQMDRAGKKLTVGGFRQLVRAVAGPPVPLETVRAALAHHLSEHRGDGPPIDDVTVLLLRRDRTGPLASAAGD